MYAWFIEHSVYLATFVTLLPFVMAQYGIIHLCMYTRDYGWSQKLLALSPGSLSWFTVFIIEYEIVRYAEEVLRSI